MPLGESLRRSSPLTPQADLLGVFYDRTILPHRSVFTQLRRHGSGSRHWPEIQRHLENFTKLLPSSSRFPHPPGCIALVRRWCDQRSQRIETHHLRSTISRVSKILYPLIPRRSLDTVTSRALPSQFAQPNRPYGKGSSSLTTTVRRLRVCPRRHLLPLTLFRIP